MTRPRLALPLAALAGLVVLPLAAGVWRQSAAKTGISAVSFEAARPPQGKARSPEEAAKPGAARRDPTAQGEEAARAPADPPVSPAEVVAEQKGKGDPTDPSHRPCATYRLARLKYLKKQAAEALLQGHLQERKP